MCGQNNQQAESVGFNWQDILSVQLCTMNPILILLDVTRKWEWASSLET